MMYKTHCQCILDTAINANFEEVSGFLLIHIENTQTTNIADDHLTSAKFQSFAKYVFFEAYHMENSKNTGHIVYI